MTTLSDSFIVNDFMSMKSTNHFWFAVKHAEYLCVGRLRDVPEITVGSGGDSTEENLLSHSAAEHHAHSVKQLLLGEQVLLLRQILDITYTFPSGDNGHLREDITINLIISMIIWWRSYFPYVWRHQRTWWISLYTFSRGSACSRNQPVTACPASW